MRQVVRLLVAAVSTLLLLQFVSVYLSWPKQMTLGGISVVLALILNRTSKSKRVTIGLMLLSIAATARYCWWRLRNISQYFSDESNHRLSIDSVLMLILLSAELYTMVVMVLGFMQISMPLRRKPIPLPPDEDLWPHIDVLIPTYNEPLSLVRYTALAANNIDYPPEKLHVYILDDGTRPDFAAFAEQAGVGYIVRAKHNHAKAGNINHALTKMNSPLVTIFDCDHVPTRSFLQVTVGWFLHDQKLAMLQTPHFFYSPDPFERNLLRFKTIPNEGELFYGVIQDGNDLWNATFFCGSCAVIRRAALNEVGGIATETVTEDAHTSLRLQKRGWNTAYINLPQAAGLATETLAAHVGQRVRWARGMIQILRTDNPLFASGMKFTQRLCYFNAMLHFMYAVPRLIFLCAPLLYMLMGRIIIPGYWLAILAYGIPHLVLSSLTNSRVQGRYRHSFWNEIYETVLAPHILLPTLLALINPKLGKFNVTDKGSTLANTTFDRHISAPTSVLLLLNFFGVCAVPYWLFVKDPQHPGTVLCNLVWILFNMVILGVAAAVANEQQQRRGAVRVPAELSVRVKLPNGEVISGTTNNMSVGGASLTLPETADCTKGTVVQVSFPVQTGDAEVGATVVALGNNSLRLNFKNVSIAEEETLTCALYSRADSWINSRDNQEIDQPMISLLRVMRLSLTGLRQVITPRSKKQESKQPQQQKASAVVGAIVLTMCCAVQVANAQFPGAQTPISPASLAHPTPTLPGTPIARPATIPQPARVSSASAITLYTAATPSIRENEASTTITLKDMGVHSTLNLRGPHSYDSAGFVLGYSRIPRRATLNLSYHFSAAVAPQGSSIRVLLNNVPLALISAPSHAQPASEFAFLALPIPAELLIRNNQLTFEFTGDTIAPLKPKEQPPILANIGATSTLLIAADPISMKRELSLLPLPFFDADLQTPTVLPFVFRNPPTPRTLEAAGIVASWFGTRAKATPVRFSVSIGDIPAGNVVLIENAAPDAAANPPAGSSLSLRANPSDPEGTMLVLAGANEAELLNAARSLALMADPDSTSIAHTSLGDTIQIGDFPLPATRGVDDAPRWLRTDRLTSLWALASEEALQSDGTRPAPVYFRAPPDLDYGEIQNLNLKLTYRYNALPLALGSSLRVYLNGLLLNEAALAPGTDFVDRRRAIFVPTASMRPFGNTLSFHFDFKPLNPDTSGQDPTTRLAGAVLQNSFIDLRGITHYASMPNLELFANAGFPFTRRADLAETVVVLPAVPTTSEITLFLYLMSHCGTQTGYPTLRVEVAGPDVVMRDDRDYLILGGTTDQPATRPLAAALPVTFDSNGVHANQNNSIQSQARQLWRRLNGNFVVPPGPTNQGGRPDLILEGIQSPTFPGRSIVVVTLRDEAALDAITEAFLDRSQSSDISQTVSLFRNGHFSSYTVDTAFYHVGSVSKYALVRIWCAQYFWLLLLLVTLASLVIAAYLSDHLDLLRQARLEGSELSEESHATNTR